MTYAKMNEREREAFDKAMVAAKNILWVMENMEAHPEQAFSIWHLHGKATEISAAVYNIQHGIYR